MGIVRSLKRLPLKGDVPGLRAAVSDMCPPREWAGVTKVRSQAKILVSHLNIWSLFIWKLHINSLLDTFLKVLYFIFLIW